MLPDKEAQEQAVRASDLEWVLVRPPQFVAGKPRVSIRVIREGKRGRLSPIWTGLRISSAGCFVVRPFAGALSFG